MMDGPDLLLTERVDEDVQFKITGAGIRYLATHELASAPDDGEAA